MVILKHISESDFLSSEKIVVFDDSTYNRCFCEILIDERGFKLGWNSDLMQPMVLCLSLETYVVGIDEYFAIVNFKTLEIIKKIKLDYNFIKVLLYQEYLFVITELEIIKLKNEDYTIENTFLLNDIFDSFKIDNNDILIETFDGNITRIEY